MEAVVLAVESGLRFRRVWARQLAAEIAPPHGDDFADLVGAESLCYDPNPNLNPNPNPHTGGRGEPVLRVHRGDGRSDARLAHTVQAGACFPVWWRWLRRAGGPRGS
jgi:hypothetical protein